MNKNAYKQRPTKRNVSLILTLVLLLLLVGCGSDAGRGNVPGRGSPTVLPRSPTVAPQPQPTSQPSPSASQEPTVTPTSEPTQPPVIVPTPTPAPVKTGPCDTEAGVRSVSAQEIAWGNANYARVALTFDAGGPVEPVPQILSILAKYRLHVTFFVTGQWAQQNPDLVRKIAQAGHQIGNHTMTHPYLTRLTDTQVCTELRQTENVVTDITGQTTHPYFRPPFGDRDARVRQLAAYIGYRTVYWSIDTIDWDTKTTSQMIIDKVMNNLGNGAIVLMHAGSTTEANTLDRLIPMIQQRGYQIVNVTNVL